MVDVSEWAKREAKARFDGPTMHVGTASDRELAAGQWGIEHLAALLLSDEAVEAAAELFYRYQTATDGYRTSIHKESWDVMARASLHAAVSAVTTTNPTTETGEPTRG